MVVNISVTFINYCLVTGIRISISFCFQNTKLSKLCLNSETMLRHFLKMFSRIDFLSSFVIYPTLCFQSCHVT